MPPVQNVKATGRNVVASCGEKPNLLFVAEWTEISPMSKVVDLIPGTNELKMLRTLADDLSDRTLRVMEGENDVTEREAQLLHLLVDSLEMAFRQAARRRQASAR
jgi:hypothetical protein